VIDLHSHVLAGLDDGPATIEGSVALARAAAAAGTRTLLGTPHVSSRYQNDPDAIAAAVERLRARLAADAVQIEIQAGAELAMSRLIEMEPATIGRYALGGGDWILVECPLSSPESGFQILVLELIHRGHRVLLAHPERCPAFHRDPGALRSLVDAGALTSITAGALGGRFGRQVRLFALGLFREGIAHNVCSDAHDELRRPPTIAPELQQAALGPLREWLTEAVPSAILAGGELPSRPAVGLAELERRGRSRWRLLRR
jgi:protein-tyrosine phosphatase